MNTESNKANNHLEERKPLMEFIKCEYCGYESDIVPYKANARIAELETMNKNLSDAIKFDVHEGRLMHEKISSLESELKALREERDRMVEMDLKAAVSIDKERDELAMQFGSWLRNTTTGFSTMKQLLEQFKATKTKPKS